MENKINIAELLKDCPKGMELDCLLFENSPTYFCEVITNTAYPIKIEVEYPSKELETFYFNKYGAACDRPTAKCIIFPKGKNTWEGFVPPCKFKDGDIIVTTLGNIAIISEHIKKESFYTHALLVGNEFYNDVNAQVFVKRLATEEEKQKIFQAIKDNGYKWNTETKALEKLVEPKFKVGDILQDKDTCYKTKIIEVRREHELYVAKSLSYDRNPIGLDFVPFREQDNWELVPDKFDITTLKPFDKVLIRNTETTYWRPALFGKRMSYKSSNFITSAGFTTFCIPYEGNEHLLGSTKNCDEFYKT